jgi:hypothetical protein
MAAMPLAAATLGSTIDCGLTVSKVTPGGEAIGTALAVGAGAFAANAAVVIANKDVARLKGRTRMRLILLRWRLWWP